jgi:hypothetical protein
MLRKQGSTCISTVSDASSLEGSEFSLQNTKKMHNFEGDSQSNIINEHYYNHGTMEYPIISQLRQNTEFSQKQMYARCNSVDELVFDRPRYKMVDARSNSVDDLSVI